MANDTEPKYVNQLFKDLADNSTGPVTQRTILYGWDPVGLQKVKLKVASDGTLATSATLSGGGGDGSILDGANNAIKATVLNLASGNPLSVAIVDTSGNQISSFGGGTQYTEDAAAASDPVGNMLMAVRRDTLSTSEVSADGDNIALKATNKGQLHVKLADTITVDGSGVTQPVSGTVTVQQSTAGNLNMVAFGYDGTTQRALSVSSAGVLHVDDNSSSLTIDATSLPLPTGAATAAKQPALGTAGSASSDVITVQGIASMTALKVDGSAVTQPVSGTVTATLSSSTNAGATAKTSDYDTGAGTDTVTMMGIALPASGGAVQGGTATNPIQVSLANTAANSTAIKVDGSAVTQPVSGTFWQSTQPVSLASVPSHNVTNAGTFAVQATEADGANTTLGSKADAKSTATDTTAVTIMSVLKQISASVQAPPSQAVTNAGTFAVQAAQSGTWTVQPGNTANTTAWKVDASSVAVPITDNSGSLTVDAPVGTPLFATLTPSTTGGWSVKSLVALSNTKTAVKAGAGTMGGYMFYNPNSSVAYIQVWNVAIGSITVGTTAPTYVIPLPATSGANVEFTNGINHSTEINVAATTTATGSTAPSTAIDGFMIYK